MANKKSLSLLLVLMFMLVVPAATALDFDNVKDSIDTKGQAFTIGETEVQYNSIWEKYQPIEITNIFGLGKTLFQGAIIQHTETCGADCSSTMQIYLGEDSVLIDDVDFYTINNDGSRTKQDVRSYQFYIDDEYYSLGTVVPSGIYEVRLEASKKPSRTVDWVIKTNGETLNEWAIWQGANDLIISSSQEMCGTYTGYNNIIINNSATITICTKTGTPNTGELRLYAYGNITIEEGVTINGNGKGANSTGNGGTGSQYMGGSGQNYAGGGGGAGYKSNGGSGGYGGSPSASGGSGGSSFGSDNILDFAMGSTGGNGAESGNGQIGIGGKGGAKMYIQAYNVNILGTITLNGASGSAGSYGGDGAGSGGGGGSAGTLTIFTKNTNISESTLTTRGGNGGAGNANDDDGQYTSCAGGGGGGSGGRIKIFYETNFYNVSTSITYTGGSGGAKDAQSVPTCANGASGGSGSIIYNQTTYSEIGYGLVTLNSPEDNFTSSIPEIEFSCSAEIIGGATLVNMSLYTNESGVWEVKNMTTGLSGTSSTQTWNRTITESTLWTCSAGDSDGDTGFATENRTVHLDTMAPVINITYPGTSFDYTYLGQNFTLNWTVSDSSLDSCWYNYNNTNTTVTCTDLNASFILTDQKNITFYANDSVSNEANYTRSWIYKIFGRSQTYNLTTYETAAEGYKINLTSDGTQLILADLVYDGASYTGTKVGNNLEMEFNRNIIIPTVSISTAQNKSFYWNITYGSELIPTDINNQSVGIIVLGLCNATLTTPYINLTFKDEETTIATNATIDTSTWTYYLASGDGTVNKTLLYSTTNANESYGFCFIPSDKTMKVNLELQYSDTGYPQRRWSTSGSLTNTTSTPTLYMLASADGTYSVYQVQNIVGNGIQGVEVIVERQFVGVWTLVEQGITDSAGGFTAWLNPDYDHRLTFTKSGLTTVQVTVRPSSSTYTVVMSGGDGAAVYNSSLEGLSWVVYPDLGKILFPNTTQLFLFNITANKSNLVSCKMEIINNNSISLGSTTGCNSAGGNISLSIPLGNNRSVRAIYSINIGDGYYVLDSDAYWIVMTTNIPERGTLTSFFKYARELNEFGNDNNRQEFSRVVSFFLILAVIMAFISLTTGWDLITTGGSLVFMNFIIIFGSYAGFLTLSYTGVNAWMDQYVVALITSLFTVGFIFNKMERRV